MELVAQMAVLATATVVAAAAAYGMAWAFLQGAFRLMQPATQTRVQKAKLEQTHARLELGPGIRAGARGFARS